MRNRIRVLYVELHKCTDYDLVWVTVISDLRDNLNVLNKMRVIYVVYRVRSK